VIVRSTDKGLGSVKIVQTTTIDPPPEPVEVTLAQSAAADFQVSDPDGRPLSDAKPGVHSWLFDYVSIGFDIPEVAPDFANLGGGRYRATGLIPQWDYRLRARAEGYKCRKELKVVARPGETVDAGTLALDWWGRKAVPGLIARLRDANPYVRSEACQELSSLGFEGQEAVAVLITALNEDPVNWVRFAAAEALGKIGPAAEASVPDLIRALQEDRLGVPREAATALGRLGAVQAIPALVAGLEHEDRDVQVASAAALGEIGPAAAQAVPALIKALRDQANWHVGREAAVALGRIGDPTALPALREAAGHKVGHVREAAAEAIKTIEGGGTVAPPARPTTKPADTTAPEAE